MKLNWIFIILILTFSSVLTSQPATEIPTAYKQEAADEALATGDIYNAVKLLEQVYRDERSIETGFAIANLHYKLRDYKRAATWFDRMFDKSKPEENMIKRFAYGRVLKMLGRYDDAREQLNLFVQSNVPDQLKALAFTELQGIGMAQNMARPIDLEVSNLGTRLNSRYSEGSPSVDQEGNLYFVSIYENKLQRGKDANNASSKVYKSSMVKNKWAKGKSISKALNVNGRNIGAFHIVPDGSVAYATVISQVGNELASSTIYYANKRGGSWSSLTSCDGLGDFVNKNPCYGELYGEEGILFSSNRPGGQGGFDLYFAKKVGEGQFTNVINLGPKINTSGNEISPFWKDGELFFSSTGHPGLGGYDIFKSVWNGSEWSASENIGKGYNSPQDDNSFYLSDDLVTGFITSNRDGTRSINGKTCCDDIYGFAKRKIKVNLLANVFEDDIPLPAAKVEVYRVYDKDRGTPDVQSKTNSHEYEFALDRDAHYDVIVSKPGYVSDTASFNTVGVVENKTYRGLFKLKPIPEDKVTDDAFDSYYINEPIRLNNIYYDFDDDKILIEAEKDLDFLYKLLMDHPKIVIELSSHTDSQGKDAYNEDLSQRRANSAKKYLIDRGIPADRIRAVGYGETQILNKCRNGVRCSDDEHRVNRRTEFKIIEGPRVLQVRKKGVKQKSSTDTGMSLKNVPKIKFAQDTFFLGNIKKGEKRNTEFEFVNVGKTDLKIELASSCKCTSVDWPRQPIKPGKKGIIKITYDSTKEEIGEEIKVLDILANTEPIITECFFQVNVVN